MKHLVHKAVALLCAFGLLAGGVLGADAATVKKLADPDATVTVSPLTVTKGSPFEVYTVFTQQIEDVDYGPDDIDRIGISVSSVTNAVSLEKSGFSSDKQEIIIDDITSDEETDSSGVVRKYNYRYTLKIPEKYIKRTGNDYGALKFSITYYQDEGDSSFKKLDTFTVQKTLFGRIEGTSSSEPEKEKPALSVESYTVDPSRALKEGDKFALNIVVKNNSGVECKDVTAGLTLDGEGTLYTNGTTNTRNVKQLGAGESTTLSFPLACAAKLKTKSYPITVKITSPDVTASGDPPVIYIPITGTVKEEEGKKPPASSKPQIIIESYDYGGLSVTGGKTFTLTMNFRNTSTKTSIENLKMTVASAPDGDKGVLAFTPANSSNTFFIDRVAPGATFQKKIDLFPKVDAEPKSYGVLVSYAFEALLDGERQSDLKGEETIAIPLFQPDRFEVNEVSVSPQMFIGEQGQLSVKYVNKGKSKIYNLEIKLDGNFTTTDPTTNIGNVDSGVGDEFQTSLTPTEEGMLNGTITFNYEDANGETKEIVKEFASEVVAMQPMPDPGEDIPTDIPVDGGNKLPTWAVVAIGCGGALVFLTILVTVIKKRKAKKLRAMDEEEDYDDLSLVSTGKKDGGDKP